jgi:hypothetical protein
LSGRRQFLFITGEAGLGKTALVETFLDAINADRSLWVGRGQCIEHYGAGEAYLPVLEALGRLCQLPGGDDLVAFWRGECRYGWCRCPGFSARHSSRRYSIG